jgi:hypothetical protein
MRQMRADLVRRRNNTQENFLGAVPEYGAKLLAQKPEGGKKFECS